MLGIRFAIVLISLNYKAIVFALGGNFRNFDITIYGWSKDIVFTCITCHLNLYHENIYDFAMFHHYEMIPVGSFTGTNWIQIH